MLAAYGKELRRFMANTNLQQIINFGDVQFFEGAATIVCIFVTKKDGQLSDVQALSLNQKTYYGDFINEVKAGLENYPHEEFGEAEWSIQPRAHLNILKKMKKGTPLKDMPIEINYGIKTGYNDAFFIDGETRRRLIAEDSQSAELIKPLLRGRDINVWYAYKDDQYLISTFPALTLNIDEYPAIRDYLLSFGKARLEQTGLPGARKKTSNNWFETQDQISYYSEFAKPKIIYPNMTSVFPFAYDENGFMGNDKTFFITAKDNSVNLKFLTAIFNSQLCKLWIWYNCPELLGGTREIRKVYFENFCIPECADQQPFIDLADKMLSLHKDLQAKRARFLDSVKDNMPSVKITSVLENFDSSDFAGFLAELKKQKIKLSLPEQEEWRSYFNQRKIECEALTSAIAATDAEIDSRVYALYGLTDEEKSIIEQS